MKDKMKAFSLDLDVIMTEVHELMEHWGLGDYKEYLVIRRPDKTQSFVVLSHPADTSDFAKKLVALHKHEVMPTGAETSIPEAKELESSEVL